MTDKESRPLNFSDSLPISILHLKQFAGLKGTDAANALQNLGAPTITQDQANAIQTNQIGVYTNTIANAYNATRANLANGLTFAMLPAQAQTAIVDIGCIQGTHGLEAHNSGCK